MALDFRESRYLPGPDPDWRAYVQAGWDVRRWRMPFGHDCEYATFDACVTDQQSKGHDEDSARRICGALQRDTEAKCAGRSADPGVEDAVAA